MTQGLQFSLMFNGLDSTVSSEQAAAGQFNDPASAQQAGVFRQLLQDKQQNNTAGQNVAANSRQANKAQAAAADSTEQTKPSNTKSVVITADNRAVFTEPKMVTDPMLPDNVEASAELASELDIAGQWLGLIKQSTDTSAQLRYRAQIAAEFFHIQPKPDFQTIGPVPSPEDSLFSEFDAKLLGAEMLAGDVEVDSFTAAQLAASKLTAQALSAEQQVAKTPATKAEDTDAAVLAKVLSSDEPKAAINLDNAKAALIHASAAATPAVSDKVLTQAEQEQEQAVALLALRQKTSATELTLSDRPIVDRLTPIIPITDDAALAEVINPNLSDVAHEKTADKAATLAALETTAVKAENKAVSDDPAVKALTTVTSESSEQPELDAILSKAPQVLTSNAEPVLAATTASASRATVSPLTAKEQNTQTAQTANPNAVDAELKTASHALTGQAAAINLAETGVANKSASQSSTINKDADLLASDVLQTERAFADLEAQIAASNTLNIKTNNVETPLASVAAVNSTAIPSSAQNAATAAMQNAVLQNAAVSNVTAEQAEPIIVTAPTAELTKVTSASIETAANPKLNTLEGVAKNAANSEQQHEQSGQQRQDARQFAAVNLEVSLAQQANNAPVASSASPTASELANNMLRAEGFAGALEQQTRANQSKAPVATLPTSMQQLQLQQDAAGQLRERVQIMVRQNIQVAEIRLDPAELGQMQIRVNLQQDQASVQFIVQQPHAKELLEQQMPRLRELLQQQGIQLGEGQVQQQSRQDRQSADSGSQQSQGQGSALFDDEDGLVQERSVEVQHSERIVDYYA